MKKKYKKEIIQNAVLKSKNYSDVIRNLGLTPNGGNHRMIVRYIRIYSIDISHFNKNIKTSQETIDLIKEKSSSVSSYTSLIKSIGWKLGGNSYTLISKIIEENNIDISHFTGKSWSKGLTKSNNCIISDQSKRRRCNISDEDIFCEKSKYSNKAITLRLLEDYEWSYECSICGLKEWLEKEITLHLDHVNGIDSDNRFVNLRFLCPNCHQQTLTWGNKKR